VIGFGIYVLILTAALLVPLVALVRYALDDDLHSHIVLVPLVTAWLLWTGRGEFQGMFRGSIPGALGFGLLGAACLAAVLAPLGATHFLGANAGFSLTAAAYAAFLVAGLLAFFGWGWMRGFLFPVVFLVFMIPLPDRVVPVVEHWLVLGSAEVTNVLFHLTGTPFLRIDAVNFELPKIGGIQVAQECSGIRSSWVLFITSLLAAHVFLRTAWKRWTLVLFVIPLGLVRNGLRILTITLLSIHVDPAMMDGPIHKQGGPFFFAASLVPLFLLLWWLRRTERGAAARP
jgi:exosortase C (VPDSG-CTERM-specific)